MIIGKEKKTRKSRGIKLKSFIRDVFFEFSRVIFDLKERRQSTRGQTLESDLLKTEDLFDVGLQFTLRHLYLYFFLRWESGNIIVHNNRSTIKPNISRAGDYMQCIQIGKHKFSTCWTFLFLSQLSRPLSTRSFSLSFSAAPPKYLLQVFPNLFGNCAHSQKLISGRNGKRKKW